MTWQQLIGGEWVGAAGGGTWDLVNPATEAVIDTLPFGDGADAAAAIDAAHAALPAWAGLTPFRRGQVLEAAADLLAARVEENAAITTEESGKPIAEARAEWMGAPNYLRFAAAEARQLQGRHVAARQPGTRIDVTYRPVGVVGVITAWNFPVYNVIRAVSAALAAGCTVVSRPSEYTPRSAMIIAQALHDAGAPAGVINVINGDAPSMGQTMLDDPRCRKISFTGSTRVGKLLMEGASRTVTRLALELGGNAPVLVFDDVDVEAVATASVAAKLRNCGQVCIAPQRFYVHRAVFDEFVDRAADAMARQVVGNGSDPATTLGPLINAAQRDRLEGLMAESVDAGVKVVTGGRRPVDRMSGYFYEPTLVTGAGPGTALHDTEIFGPVMPVIPFDDEHEVLVAANAVEYGLAAYLQTRQLDRATRVSERLEYGMVGVNTWGLATPEAPFGGVKQSGIGRESGAEGVLDYVDPITRHVGISV